MERQEPRLLVKAQTGKRPMRETSSTQTWTNSQPAPSPLARALLCRLRSPVMRCPIRWKRPSLSRRTMAGRINLSTPLH
jgi:hypothetical protein